MEKAFVRYIQNSQSNESDETWTEKTDDSLHFKHICCSGKTCVQHPKSIHITDTSSFSNTFADCPLDKTKMFCNIIEEEWTYVYRINSCSLLSLSLVCLLFAKPFWMGVFPFCFSLPLRLLFRYFYTKLLVDHWASGDCHQDMFKLIMQNHHNFSGFFFFFFWKFSLSVWFPIYDNKQKQKKKKMFSGLSSRKFLFLINFVSTFCPEETFFWYFHQFDFHISVLFWFSSVR